MSVAECPSDPAQLPAYVRAQGAIRARFDAQGGATRIAELYETGGYRMRFPRGPRCEAVIVNTGGGVAGGDHVTMSFAAGPGAQVVCTTATAEKIYRSDGATAQIDVQLDLGAGASLAWLPQETILFDAAALRRRLDVSLAADSRLTLLECVTFGRGAMGETCARGAFRDRWRVRREGRLVFAEEMRFDGAIHSLLDRLAIGAGARAAATLVHVGPEASSRLDALRAALDVPECEAAASSWDGLLVARLVSPLPHALRRAVMAAAQTLDAPVPRLWAM